MGGPSHFLLFLVSVFIFTSVAGLRELVENKQLATIHVLNAMPNDSQPLQLRCSSRFTDHGMQEVGVGDDYQCGVKEKALYFCEAFMGRYFSSWHAFQPGRDGSRKAVFWLVKPEGFFLSYDNSTWVRKSRWETE